ncbi:heavy-metal-associated domain-containing protein [Halanaerobium congolense]|uniref:Heavy-metal-associated domain-containing protein n=1 Tax=Halanaerobium congolense TaxID=54121 RepID=A0A4R8GSZ1_9FIRM|nr:cation transporter [Halanaerobium congolense]TDX46574.1 heavy-metal-associated domain-containing protein [Halanaerobium congolense]
MTEATLVKSKYKAKYILNGLSCSNCAAKIEKAVQELPYVLEAEMNFAVSKILIEGNSDKVENMTKELQELVDQIESGITVEQGSGKIREYSQKYILEGLTCSNCAGKIEKAVNDLPQVEKAELNFATSKISIQGENIDNSSFRGKLQEIADRIEPGLTIREAESKANKENSNDNSHAQDYNHGTEEENSYMKRRFWPGVVLFAIAIILFEIPAIRSKVAELPAFIEWILYGSSYLLIGGPVLMAAYKNIKRGQVFDENFLMGIATIGAFAIQEFPEGVAVMLFYMVGEMFQEKAVDRSRRSIKSLILNYS